MSPAELLAKYDIPLTHGGGNFHLFQDGDAFMTELVLVENPTLTASDVENAFLQYQNLHLTIYPGFPTSFDSTRHIDMWMLPLTDSKVIIGQYDANQGSGIPKQVTDATANLMQSRGYTVYRTPGWRSGAHYTYTNSVIVNQMVLICRFGGSYTSQDAQALATYQSALPDHDIVQVDCSDIIFNAGAIHSSSSVAGVIG